mmetsp:Transcript_10172/g.13594  ORF Transcript_10172/g.13594 Transcript_10172/m.13594 type:complete len:567 (+) Transcript_10172:304-2004(+)
MAQKRAENATVIIFILLSFIIFTDNKKESTRGKSHVENPSLISQQQDPQDPQDPPPRCMRNRNRAARNRKTTHALIWKFGNPSRATETNVECVFARVQQPARMTRPTLSEMQKEALEVNSPNMTQLEELAKIVRKHPPLMAIVLILLICSVTSCTNAFIAPINLFSHLKPPQKCNQQQQQIRYIIHPFTSDKMTRQKWSRREMIMSNSNNENNKEEESTMEEWKAPPCTKSSIAKTLDGRLLCASQCAYDTKSPSARPYIRGASFLPGHKVKRITNSKINSALIGKTTTTTNDGKTTDGIVIAFRGTLTNSPIDWLQNAALFLSDVIARRDKLVSWGSRVHVGFYGAVRSLWKPLKSTVLSMLRSSNSKNIYLTGHSKGGAMASIAALIMSDDDDFKSYNIYVATFASVKFGNSHFRDEYNAKVNQTTYESHLDLIPFLPPSQSMMNMMESMDGGDEMMKMIDDIMWSKKEMKTKNNYVWDYQPVGKRIFINEHGKIITNVTEEVDNKRIQDIEAKTFLSLSKFCAAHCSSCADNDDDDDDTGKKCDGGYFRGIAPEICNGCDFDE